MDPRPGHSGDHFSGAPGVQQLSHLPLRVSVVLSAMKPRITQRIEKKSTHGIVAAPTAALAPSNHSQAESGVDIGLPMNCFLRNSARSAFSSGVSVPLASACRIAFLLYKMEGLLAEAGE